MVGVCHNCGHDTNHPTCHYRLFGKFCTRCRPDLMRYLYRIIVMNRRTVSAAERR